MNVLQTNDEGRRGFMAVFAVVGIVVLLVMIVAMLGGTGQTDRSALFIPSVPVAESAVTACMEQWKRGEPSGAIPDTKPLIHVIDRHRKPGQVLKSYQVLGEVPGNAPRCFAVKAEMENPDRTERYKYIVVGIDPLWVFRQEDYDLLSHWEHPMEDSKKAESPPAK